MKSRGSTADPHGKPLGSSPEEESGIPGVAVKCADIRKNTRSEGGSLGRY